MYTLCSGRRSQIEQVHHVIQVVMCVPCSVPCVLSTVQCVNCELVEYTGRRNSVPARQDGDSVPCVSCM